MKKFTKSLLSIAVLGGVSSVAMAADAPLSVSANVALTSDYVWRGTSQTNEDPAIQGGFDVSHSSGFYLGTWGSNVNYGDDSSMELDLYAGFANELASGLGYDVSYARFLYPGEENSAYGEFALALSYNIASLTYRYAPDFPDYTGDGDDDSTHYLEFGLEYELAQGFTLGGTLGWMQFPDASGGDDDYLNWSLSVGTSVGGVDLSLAYTDTDIDNDPLADGRAVFTISKSF